MYQLDNSQNVMVKAALFSLLSMSTFTDLNNAHIEKIQIYTNYFFYAWKRTNYCFEIDSNGEALIQIGSALTAPPQFKFN